PGSPARSAPWPTPWPTSATASRPTRPWPGRSLTPREPDKEPEAMGRRLLTTRRAFTFGVVLVLSATATATGAEPAKVGARLERSGDEIVAAGQFFHTTAPVVLWTDPGGYDAYRVERRFAPREEASWEKSQGGSLRSPNRYSQRTRGLSAGDVERVRG